MAHRPCGAGRTAEGDKPVGKASPRCAGGHRCNDGVAYSRRCSSLCRVIFDSHCHAWRAWPYDSAVPDPGHRGSIESLLYEMDRHGVERAMVVCARIGDDVGPAWSNEDNNSYVDAAVRRFPDRLSMVADVDCTWRPEYHTAGAAARLQQAIDRYDLVGFTHYVRLPEDGWFDSEDGRAFFDVAAANNLLASIAAAPAWQPAVHRLAQRYPDLPILLHHRANYGCRARTSPPTSKPCSPAPPSPTST